MLRLRDFWERYGGAEMMHLLYPIQMLVCSDLLIKRPLIATDYLNSYIHANLVTYSAYVVVFMLMNELFTVVNSSRKSHRLNHKTMILAKGANAGKSHLGIAV